MKYIVISVISIITLLSCSNVCSHDAEDKLSKWEESKPTHYAYTIQRISFTSLEYLGPYRFEILNDAIDTIYFDLNSYPGTPDELFDGWDNYESVQSFASNSRIEDVFERLTTNESDCTVTYDETYHFPTEYKLISEPEIPDSGLTIRISNFEILE